MGGVELGKSSAVESLKSEGSSSSVLNLLNSAIDALDHSVNSPPKSDVNAKSVNVNFTGKELLENHESKQVKLCEIEASEVLNNGELLSLGSLYEAGVNCVNSTDEIHKESIEKNARNEAIEVAKESSINEKIVNDEVVLSKSLKEVSVKCVNSMDAIHKEYSALNAKNEVKKIKRVSFDKNVKIITSRNKSSKPKKSVNIKCKLESVNGGNMKRNLCETYKMKLATVDVSHLGSSGPCVNFQPTCLPMDKVESCKRLALGTGKKPILAVQKIKAGSSVNNDKLCEILSNLEISAPVRCCVDGECEVCVMTELGKIVSNCLIDARKKCTPSMLSHRSMGILSPNSGFFKLFGKKDHVLPSNSSVDIVNPTMSPVPAKKDGLMVENG